MIEGQGVCVYVSNERCAYMLLTHKFSVSCAVSFPFNTGVLYIRYRHGMAWTDIYFQKMLFVIKRNLFCLYMHWYITCMHNLVYFIISWEWFVLLNMRNLILYYFICRYYRISELACLRNLIYAIAMSYNFYYIGSCF